MTDERTIVLLDDDAAVRFLDDAQFAIGNRALAAIAFQVIERPLLGRRLAIAPTDFLTAEAAAIAWRHLLRRLRLRRLDTGRSYGRPSDIRIAATVAVTVAGRPTAVGSGSVVASFLLLALLIPLLILANAVLLLAFVLLLLLGALGLLLLALLIPLLILANAVLLLTFVLLLLLGALGLLLLALLIPLLILANAVLLLAFVLLLFLERSASCSWRF